MCFLFWSSSCYRSLQQQREQQGATMATVLQQQTVTNGTNWATSNERQQIERRLALIHRDIELKRAAIKNLRLSLQQTNVSEWVLVSFCTWRGGRNLRGLSGPPISGFLWILSSVSLFHFRAATSTRTSDRPRLNTSWRGKKRICWTFKMKNGRCSCASAGPFTSGDGTESAAAAAAATTSPARYSGLLAPVSCF